MNLANLTPAWLKRFVVQRMITKDDFESFSGKPKPVEQPVPELSCLAKGIIKSIQEHPEEWPVTPEQGSAWDRTHTETKMRLSSHYGWMHIDGARLFNPDSDALYTVLDNLINGPARKAAAERRAIFEKLGCPDQEGPTNVQS